MEQLCHTMGVYGIKVTDFAFASHNETENKGKVMKRGTFAFTRTEWTVLCLNPLRPTADTIQKAS